MDTNPASWDYAAPIGTIFGPMSAKVVTAHVKEIRAGFRKATAERHGMYPNKKAVHSRFEILGVLDSDEGFVEACLTEWGIIR